MDVFCEYIIKKKKEAKEILLISALIIAGILLSVFGFVLAAVFASEISFSIYVAALIVIWYFVYIYITRQNIEYEFTFTNGESDVDQIFSRKRRVHMLSVRVREFEICAKINDERYKNEFEKAKHLKKIYSAHSSSKSENVYFADFYLKAEKVRLIFEPSINMINKMKLYNEKNIHLKE